MSARTDGKSPNKAESAGSNGGDAASEGNNVDKIRELLFGEQMTGYEARFKALESKLIAEVESLRQTVEDSVSELRAQFDERADAVEDASVAREKLADSLEKLARNLRD